jgi:SAM-dependent MidA family methyltransferase
MIGKQLEEMWIITGRKEFAVIEYGAGTGMLCHDILDYCQNIPAFYKCLRYYIIEKSPFMRQKEKEHLTGKVSWINSIRDIGPLTGCILSNELVDNFSVHRVLMEDELMEIFVDHKNGFVECLMPAQDSLKDYFSVLNVALPRGFSTEINLEAIEWIKEIAGCLKQGFVITIDYGYSSSELYRDCRRNGTLLCYYQHTFNDQLYENIGRQDITAHINFSALSVWGSKNGLNTCGFTRQAFFLLALGWEEYLRKILLERQDDHFNFKQYAFLKYTSLIDMGQKFKILVQGKGVRNVKLKGFTQNKKIPAFSLV